ncbi:DUF5689 domain-containing protein [Pedobacter sp. MW01-1-1]|uniref:DUF5689 domain-containing protein n=1 Tax=Pedobacter sp. MW01-1-1 TaxID=3383027 RepID=UPI003FEEFE93
MKRFLNHSLILLVVALLAACEKTKYPAGDIGPYIPMLDLRSLYKGSELTLSADNMFGSSKISGVVVSDHSGGNMPAGYLILQDRKRLSKLRGITIALGSDAAKYVPGDSISVEISGGILTRENGVLQVKNVSPGNVTKLASGLAIPPNRVPSSYILANPDQYESTLVAIVKGGFDPVPAPTDTFSGDKMVNDGFDNITLHTESAAAFASNSLPFLANFYGVVLSKAGSDGKLVPEVRLRKKEDVVVLSSTVSIPAMIISGWIADPKGTDANNEYIQFLATRDIDFAVTPFSVVTTNNAGASTPTINPTNGWALGDLRTYKFNLTSGKAAKGTYFYVGGANKLINSATGGVNSTSIASSNWIRSFNYSTTSGDGFGTKTTNLLANSGNAYGVAVFEGTNVTEASTPIDALFVGTGGLLYAAGPPAVGYRIANNDIYDVVNPITLAPQPFYRQGTNTINFSYTTPSDAGFYYKFGGVYSVTLGKWVKARTQTNIQLTLTSTLAEIEGVYPAPTPENPTGTPATQLK